MTLEEDVTDFATAIEAAALNLKQRIAERHGVSEESEKNVVSEKNFDLAYTKQTGAKIGEFKVTDKKDNDPEKFQRALNILAQNGATISKRFAGEGYVYRYWSWKDRIYRQAK